jgi:nucleotide-binding universal stress UspA family protein
MFQHILVPLDGSTRAEHALPVAARIARATDGSVLLVQVINLPIDYSGGLTPALLMTEQMIEAEMDGATDYLKAMAASQILAGIETRTEASIGLPAQYLIAVTESQDCDLVVLCSHGRTGLTRWALGSVAHSLVHQSAVPVLVLRQENVLSLSSNREQPRPLRTLVPLDGSPLAEAALSPAAHLTAALATPAQGALHLVQVVKPFPTTTEEGFVSELNAEAVQRAKGYLATAAERVQSTVKDLKLAVTSSVELGTDVASTLVSLAEHGSKGMPHDESGAICLGGRFGRGIGPCDLIAISTHGRGGLERWVMGSVTDRVLNTTRLPILTVRPPKK